MAGRKPKPTHLKLVAGNPGKRPPNENEPQPEGDLEDAPEGLTPSQQA
ncbi:MAG: phage terminase small subunit P27 family, partial [Vulcanimicrobiaceae bacterium]